MAAGDYFSKFRRNNTDTVQYSEELEQVYEEWKDLEAEYKDLLRRVGFSRLTGSEQRLADDCERARRRYEALLAKESRAQGAQQAAQKAEKKERQATQKTEEKTSKDVQEEQESQKEPEVEQEEEYEEESQYSYHERVPQKRTLFQKMLGINKPILAHEKSPIVTNNIEVEEREVNTKAYVCIRKGTRTRK